MARELAGISQSELARIIDVSPQSVQQWEAGSAAPRRKRLGKIAAALKKSVAWLELGYDADAIAETGAGYQDGSIVVQKIAAAASRLTYEQQNTLLLFLESLINGEGDISNESFRCH